MSNNMKEIRLTVGRLSGKMGESDDTKEIKFNGKQIASYNSYHGETSSGDDRGTTHTLYKTEKDKFLLHTNRWSRWQGESSNKNYEIFDSIKEIQGEVPDGLIYEAKEAMVQDPAEKLNI